MKVYNSVLYLTVAALLGCRGELPLPDQRVAEPSTEISGRTETLGPEETKFSNGFALGSVETLDLQREVLLGITQFDPYHGLARLSDGRCIKLHREGPTKHLIGAIISSDTETCANLSDPREGFTGLPCDGTVTETFVGDWHLKCEQLGPNRSALVAVGARPENRSRKITLRVLDQDVQLFKIFKSHPAIADVTTLGWREDSKVAISSFFWMSNFTGIDSQNAGTHE